MIDISDLTVDADFVEAYCQRYINRGVEIDDLRKAAQEGIERAKVHYPEVYWLEPSFQAYATLWMQYYILRLFKQYKATRNVK